MTTMAAMLGGLPLAIGIGTGSELRRPLGIAIVGGLLFSQLLTLYTTRWSTSTSTASSSGGSACGKPPRAAPAPAPCPRSSEA